MVTRMRSVAIAALLALACSLDAAAQDAGAFFRSNCMSCHTIGKGRLVGPDLRNVTQRKDREWLGNFISDPPSVLTSGDPYAQKLLSEAHGVSMPKVAGINRDIAGKLLDFIEAESKKEPGAAAATAATPGAAPVVAEEAPLVISPEMAMEGRKIFTGERALASGMGAPCISCHTLANMKALGGGLLGPDLTDVYTRMSGDRALAAWLSSPASPTMKPAFGETPFSRQEIGMLVSYFKETSERRSTSEEAGATVVTMAPPTSRPFFDATAMFLLIGFIATITMLAHFDVAWKNRFRAVREPMVRGDLSRSAATRGNE